VGVRGRPRKVYESIFPPEIDWARIMTDLRVRGITPYQVAQYIGSSVCAAQNWERGGEPGYAYGVAVLELHAVSVSVTTTIYRESIGEVAG